MQAACDPPLLPDLTHPHAVPDEAAVAARAAGGGGGTLYGFVRSCDGLDVRFCTDPAAAWRATGGGGGGAPAASAAPPLSVLLLVMRRWQRASLMLVPAVVGKYPKRWQLRPRE